MTLLCKCMDEECRNPHFVELTNPDGGSTVPVRHIYTTNAIDAGAIVSQVTCPICGGELTHTDNGAYCDWDSSYVPITDTAFVDGYDERDWTDDDVS